LRGKGCGPFPFWGALNVRIILRRMEKRRVWGDLNTRCTRIFSFLCRMIRTFSTSARQISARHWSFFLPKSPRYLIAYRYTVRSRSTHHGSHTIFNDPSCYLTEAFFLCMVEYMRTNKKMDGLSTPLEYSPIYAFTPLCLRRSYAY
jgi:hypothetical protein